MKLEEVRQHAISIIRWAAPGSDTGILANETCILINKMKRLQVMARELDISNKPIRDEIHKICKEIGLE